MPHQEVIVPTSVKTSNQSHLFDWPNEAGFTAGNEQREPKKLRILGEFPPYVSGTLYRTGPGTYRVSKADGGEYSCNHWFDGFTCTHKFNLMRGSTGKMEVEYTSRGQVDGLIERARTTGKLDIITFGQKKDPCDSYFKKLKTSFRAMTYNATEPNLENIGVVINKTPGKSPSQSLTISSDISCVKGFDPSTLEAYGVINQKGLHSELRGPLSAAHPGVDPHTGDLFNFNLEFGSSPTYRVFKTCSSTGKTEILATFAEKEIPGAYIHSIFVTESYAVLCVWPAFFKNYGMRILWEKNIIDALYFDQSARTNWIVVDRRNGKGIVNRFTSDSIFAFHFVNGWEEKNENGGLDIICDLVEYKNMDILQKFYYENVVSNGPEAKRWTKAARPNLEWSLTRYCLPGIAHNATSRPLGSPAAAKILKSIPGLYSGELPRINESLMTKRHRYVYGVAMRDKSSFFDCLVKTDTEAADPSTCSILWDYPRHSPGEPVFIPEPDAKGEDDGVLLSVVLNGESGTSYLLCLDARTMTEVARAEVDDAVGFGFHGLWVT